MLKPMPTAESKVEAARRQLERVLASAGFARNERLARFLRFVVERHLEGRDDELKESVIAIEVFGRGSDHDPKQDSIVRTEAGRLRARLSEYYLGEGKNDGLVIELPKGGYVPVFRNSTLTGGAVRVRRTPALRLAFAVGLVSLVLALAAGWWRFHQNAPIPIAVLPLINLNQDPANDYFADGLTGEIIRNLSIIDGLAVRSATSSFTFKGKPQKARDAGKQLEADYLVEGSVLRSGHQLRINVQLIRASDDFPLWSGRYDREMMDIFAIQDEISRGIVNNLRLKLGRGRRRYETSTEAYDLYLRARVLPVAARIPVFEQAIAKDPSFAPAYAGLAEAYTLRSGTPNAEIPNDVTKMRTSAEAAIRLDPLSAESYDALGAVQARGGQWGQAEKSFHRAMEIEPGRAESHTDLAIFFLLPLGRIDEVIQQLRIAEKSDPLSAQVHIWLGDALADEGRNEEAVSACEKVPPENLSKQVCILGVRVRQGRAAEVMQIYEADPARRHDLRVAGIGGVFGCAYARAGRREDAEQIAAAIGANRALIYACLGDKDRVLESLDHYAAIGPIRMGWILLHVDRESPGLLRGDPRLKALRKKVGLPE